MACGSALPARRGCPCRAAACRQGSAGPPYAVKVLAIDPLDPLRLARYWIRYDWLGTGFATTGSVLDPLRLARYLFSAALIPPPPPPPPPPPGGRAFPAWESSFNLHESLNSNRHARGGRAFPAWAVLAENGVMQARPKPKTRT